MNSHFDEATKEALDNIKDIDSALNQYTKLAAGESKEWYFDPNTIEKVANKFNPQQDRFRFKVYDPEMEREFLWDVSAGAAKRVVAEMQKQNFFLRVQRTGEGMETRYTVTPVMGDSGSTEFPS
jgi:hypothetical protein